MDSLPIKSNTTLNTYKTFFYCSSSLKEDDSFKSGVIKNVASKARAKFKVDKRDDFKTETIRN